MYNFNKVFTVFKKNYQLVPLEIFGKDPYKTLVSTVLSARTRDEVTLIVSQNLFKKAPDVSSLNKLTEKEIENLIKKVGFHKTKAKHLKKLAQIVISDFKGKIPNNKKDLIKLPGVGTKTANLVLNRAFDIPAIAVDTHVHRITNLLGWVKTKTPQQTEKELEKIVPKKYWSEMNRLFVSIGRQFRTKKRLEEFLKSQKLL
ncbi:MAG TPA: endonuclease III [Patescibacteria group bacterium]